MAQDKKGYLRDMSAEQWVSECVRQWIIDGTLKANEQISQTEIANRLGVSRIPVRDALRRLESTGLVTIQPNRRAVVTSFTMDDMYEVFEIRAVLEGLAARHAVEHLSSSDMVELEAASQVMSRVSDLDTYLKKHELFHDFVALRSGMPRLREQLLHLREMVAPYIRIYGAAHYGAEMTKSRHDSLVEVLGSRDPDYAEEAFIGHARHAYKQFAETVRKLTGKDRPLGNRREGKLGDPKRASADSQLGTVESPSIPSQSRFTDGAG